jgi:hypothetical protein
MKSLALILCPFALCFSSLAQQKSDTSTIIRQVSYAEESPNVSNVSGNVTIIYGCVAKEVSTTNMIGSFGSNTGINSSGVWNITNSSSDNNASLLAMSSILPPDNLNSAWHLSGTINSQSNSDTDFSLKTSPSFLPTADVNAGFHIFDNAGSVHFGDVSSSLITVPSVLPTINLNSTWQPLGTINSSSISDTGLSLTTSPLILSTADINSGLYLFDKADYSSTNWRPSSSMSAFHDYGVASGSDQASLNLRISDAATKGQEIIGWTLIYKDSVATK